MADIPVAHKLKRAEVADLKGDPNLSAHGTEKPHHLFIRVRRL